jgi:hypothetical protein
MHKYGANPAISQFTTTTPTTAFFKLKEKSVFKTHRATLGVVNFYKFTSLNVPSKLELF